MTIFSTIFSQSAYVSCSGRMFIPMTSCFSSCVLQSDHPLIVIGPHISQVMYVVLGTYSACQCPTIIMAHSRNGFMYFVLGTQPCPTTMVILMRFMYVFGACSVIYVLLYRIWCMFCHVCISYLVRVHMSLVHVLSCMCSVLGTRASRIRFSCTGFVSHTFHDSHHMCVCCT
jgi:hypothetical protein